MNSIELLHNGHHALSEAIHGLAEGEWQTHGMVNGRSVKEVVAHLAGYEQMLVDVLNTLLGNGRPTATLDRFREQYYLAFDENEIAHRRDKTEVEVLAEYETAHDQTIQLLAQVPEHLHRKPGVPPWEGSPYDLEDFILYTVFSHKQQYAAQLALRMQA
jgi:hypothetical protein